MLRNRAQPLSSRSDSAPTWWRAEHLLASRARPAPASPTTPMTDPMLRPRSRARYSHERVRRRGSSPLWASRCCWEGPCWLLADLLSAADSAEYWSVQPNVHAVAPVRLRRISRSLARPDAATYVLLIGPRVVGKRRSASRNNWWLVMRGAMRTRPLSCPASAGR